jgi:hypothetical protein
MRKHQAAWQADPQQVQTTISDTLAALNSNTITVGFYELPGSGKTFLLNQLKPDLKLNPVGMFVWSNTWRSTSLSWNCVVLSIETIE